MQSWVKQHKKRTSLEIQLSQSRGEQQKYLRRCLRDVVWNNKYMSKDCKTRIYKTCVQPILIDVVETRGETTKTRNRLKVAEMKVLRSISGLSSINWDKVRNENIRNQCGIIDILKWTKRRCREWYKHVMWMDDERLVKQTLMSKPTTKRPLGRPPKRWINTWQDSGEESGNEQKKF